MSYCSTVCQCGTTKWKTRYGFKCGPSWFWYRGGERVGPYGSFEQASESEKNYREEVYFQEINFSSCVEEFLSFLESFSTEDQNLQQSIVNLISSLKETKMVNDMSLD